ncbi:MAG TPA: sugar ABC transporter ATP-binding protein [Clostridia bacterium]|nr:sugar ABC transporter ATP-binding protein [Clostridia bacterium]
MGKEAYLQLKNINKSFVGVPVLKDVSFTAYAGEVHALVGGNGAGKSTLMNILGGLYEKDSGEILIDGKPAEITNAQKAEQAGVGFVHQELKLFSSRSIAENIFMWRLPQKKPFGFVDDRAMKKEAAKWLKQVGITLDPSITVGELSLAEQQLVEIAKILSMNSRILILDEPTSSLTFSEVERLFEIMTKLKAEGVCIIYISHKLDEIFKICDSVTVLRDGKIISTSKISELTNEQLASTIVGRELDHYFPTLPDAPCETTENVLEVKDLKNQKLNGVSFELKKGEMLGIFGLVGAGKSETLRAIFGLDKLHSGTVAINGKVVKITTPKRAMKLGLGFVSEDRREEGLQLKLSIKHNLTLPILNRISIPVFYTVRIRRENKMVADAFKRFLIRAEGPSQRASRLSGGNQQKVVLSKWIMTNAPILMLDEPTRGVDVGAKAEIYNLISKLVRESGVSVIIVSSEEEEVLNMCHRTLIMRDGEVVAQCTNCETTEEELLLKACLRGKNG